MREKKKQQPWLIPAILGAVAVVVVAVIAFVATRPEPLPDPYKAMNKALGSVGSLPNPAAVGVLGQGELAGERFGVSGNLNLQADGSGLAVSLTDFTLGYEDGSTDLEVYINKDTMAVRDPEMGEEWYGVTLQRGLKAQAAEVADGELVEWYFTPGALEEADAAFDTLHTTLGDVHDLSFSDVIDNLKGDLAQLPATTEKTEEGFTVTFDAAGQPLPKTAEDLAALARLLLQDEHGLDEITAIILRLDEKERLTALEINADSFLFLLDMGDPNEPAPRLEVQWGEDGSVELAFTVAKGEGFTAPEYHNVFDLLNALAGKE